MPITRAKSWFLLIVVGIGGCGAWPEAPPPEPCDGQTRQDTAQHFTVVLVQSATGCPVNSLYYANTYEDALQCAIDANPGFYGASQICEYHLKVVDGAYCWTSSMLADSATNAKACYSLSCSGCSITDVTDQVVDRAPNTCIGGIIYSALDNVCP